MELFDYILCAIQFIVVCIFVELGQPDPDKDYSHGPPWDWSGF